MLTMNTKTFRLAAGAALVLLAALPVLPAQADDSITKVVSLRGLDLSSPADQAVDRRGARPVVVRRRRARLGAAENPGRGKQPCRPGRGQLACGPDYYQPGQGRGCAPGHRHQAAPVWRHADIPVRHVH